MALKSLLKIFFIIEISVQIKALEDGTDVPIDLIVDDVKLDDKKTLYNRSDGFVPFQEPRDIEIMVEMHSSESINTSDLFTPFANPENKSQVLEKQYIMRWLPTRIRRPKFSERQMHQIFTEENAKKRARESNEKKRLQVLETMKANYWTSLYLYGEVARIRKTRVVMDDMKILIRTLEDPYQKVLRKKVLGCYHDAKAEKEKYSGFWDNKNTNHVIINVVKDSPNDGVI